MLLHATCVGAVRAAGQQQEVWTCGLFFYWSGTAGRKSAAGKNKIRGEEVSGAGQMNLLGQTDSCLPKMSLLNIPPTWKPINTDLSCL